ncbi:MAG: DUF4372 domain-containing protein [Deltaproteobacteria bacterium]|jgi:hypothetical protein|nr:DUF4372 domain-containing protein [Deltaproteobacteria bacterium]
MIKIIEDCGSDKYFKEFFTNRQLVVMLYARMQGVSSLRELINCMDVFRGGINHFGLKRLPARSTLARANERRSYEVFEKIFHALIPLVSRTREASPRGKPELNFMLKGNVYNFDSSTTDLCHSLYDRAEHGRTKAESMSACCRSAMYACRRALAFLMPRTMIKRL